MIYLNHQAQVVQKVDNAIHRINHYPAWLALLTNTYPLDSDNLVDNVIRPSNHWGLKYEEYFKKID